MHITTIFIFTVVASHGFTVNALTCPSDKLKITIKGTPPEDGVTETPYDFDDFERYEMRATIAYSIQKYCGEFIKIAPCDADVYIIASNVTLTNITQRISMCVEVDNFTPYQVREAIRMSKANLNGALILTDEELFVDGILPTLSPVPEYDFPPWIIAYIVIFCLLLLGGLTIFMYAKFHKKDDDEEKQSMIDEDSSSDAESQEGNANDAFYEEIRTPGGTRNYEESATAL